MVPILTIIATVIWYWHNIKKDKSTTEISLFTELNKKDANKYLVEKLFFDIYKCGKTSYEEIEILFNHPQPLEAIKKFTLIRRFGKIFELTKKGKNISASFTENFNSKTKRRIVFSLSVAAALICYSFIMLFITATTKSIITVSISSKGNNTDLITTLFTTPEPGVFIILTILFTILCMCSVVYSAHIIMAKRTMTWLVQTYNLKIRKRNNSILHIKIIKVFTKIFK